MFAQSFKHLSFQTKLEDQKLALMSQPSQPLAGHDQVASKANPGKCAAPLGEAYLGIHQVAVQLGSGVGTAIMNHQVETFLKWARNCDTLAHFGTFWHIAAPCAPLPSRESLHPVDPGQGLPCNCHSHLIAFTTGWSAIAMQWTTPNRRRNLRLRSGSPIYPRDLHDAAEALWCEVTGLE